MKRSEINQIIINAKSFMASLNFKLPVWANWSPSEWSINKDSVNEIIHNMMGWDITDFGSGEFYKRGLFLFTIRNGNLKKDKKPYAEKIMIVEENQETPMHFHWNKMEDIINRGGGNLVVELFNSTPNEKLDVKSDVKVKVDGIEKTLVPGGKIVLRPGESICLNQGLYHRFYGEPGNGKVLVGEVSAVNDDSNDNRFLDEIGRFPIIIEDESPIHLLVSDYNKYV
ncbi:MAG: D-lyxose/D-mannose family sugar isomerase [Bacteroidales bacterium]|nr:D-lyxose/D-mannose family sugar isomerase [Bacteroidales bacterium]